MHDLQDGKAMFPSVGYIRARVDQGTPDAPSVRTSAGTGFLVEDDKIVTAAHVLFLPDGTMLDTLQIYFGLVTLTTYLERASGSVADCIIPQQWSKSDMLRTTAHDLAVCPITRPKKNDAVQPFHLADAPVNPMPMTLVGYPLPATYPPDYKDQVPAGTPFMATGDATWYDGSTLPALVRQLNGENVWGYKVPATIGQSGSPLIGDNGVIGIHSEGYGSANNAAVGLNLGAPAAGTPSNVLPVPPGT